MQQPLGKGLQLTVEAHDVVSWVLFGQQDGHVRAALAKREVNVTQKRREVRTDEVRVG